MIRKRSSVICVKDAKLLTVALEDPYLKLTRLYLPGGRVEEEKGELPSQAASRETLEETGWQVSLRDEMGQILEYDFFWNGRHVPCQTYFFVADLMSEIAENRQVDEADYQRGIEWLPLARLRDEFDYHPRILWQIEKMISEFY